MKLGVILTEQARTESTYERLQAEKLSVVLAGNGIYHAVVKADGKPSKVLDKAADFYVLTEDMETRGFTAGDLVDGKIKPIDMSQLVDLIMVEHDKFVWL